MRPRRATLRCCYPMAATASGERPDEHSVAAAAVVGARAGVTDLAHSEGGGRPPRGVAADRRPRVSPVDDAGPPTDDTERDTAKRASSPKAHPRLGWVHAPDLSPTTRKSTPS